MSDQPIERNSSGERLYHDTSGAKCNIRGMIKREPGWVASRFDVMTDQLADAKADVKGLRLDREPLKADYVRMYQLCVGYQAALAAADELAEEVESHWTDIPRLVVLTDHYLAARSGKGEGSKP